MGEHRGYSQVQYPLDKHLIVCYPIIIHKQERDLKVGKIKFVCPSCKSLMGLEEIMCDVVQSTTFDYIDIMGFEIDYTHSSTDGGVVDRFQCVECGYILTNSNGTEIIDTEDLCAWLMANNMIEHT